MRFTLRELILPILRYFPDFVARLENGERWLMETKGAETIQVAHKGRAAILWCQTLPYLPARPEYT